MPFWDRFVLWVYLGLAEVLPVGRDAVARLCERAHRSRQPHRLDLGHANDLTVLLVAGTCRPGRPARIAAEAEFASRHLSTEYDRVRALLQHLQPPRVTELLELKRPHHALPAQLLYGVMTAEPGHEILLNLVDFLSKIRVATPAATRREAVTSLLGAITRYYRFPMGTIDFFSLLYRHACGYLQIGTPPLPAFVPSHPLLLEIPDADEREFLLRCGRLTETDRVLLYLNFYARLTAEQIAGMLRFSDPTWTADRVVIEIERCWNAVL